MDELRARLVRIRDGWASIRDGNRALGWPEQAHCVQMPRDFVDQLDAALCDCCIEGLFTTWFGHGVTCRDCQHPSRVHQRKKVTE